MRARRKTGPMLFVWTHTRMRGEKIIHGFDRHGRRHPIYTAWAGMKDRCYRKKCAGYKNYGGRGISVCEKWRNDFVAFKEWAIAAGHRQGLSIDRIFNDGDYSPENCRWADRKTQNRNSRHCNMIAIDGETRPLAAWLEDTRCKIKENTFYLRIKRGWSQRDALFVDPTPRALRHYVNA